MTPSDQSNCPDCHERPGVKRYKRQGVPLCLRCYDRRWRADHPGFVTARTRHYRSDPAKAERDRERSRRWKREHLGQPGRPA